VNEGCRLVVDANILIRATLGKRVRVILEEYGDTVDLFAPQVAYDDAQRHLPSLLAKRNRPVGSDDEATAYLEALKVIIRPIDNDLYAAYEADARARIGHRDPDDWPIVAAALALNCPVWTEDHDFFGIGIATWKTEFVEIYLRFDS